MTGQNLGISGVGVGVGSDSGQASSTTTAGISGIAGDTAVRSSDAETGIQRIFDQEKVQKEIDAQVAITEAFGRDASKAIGDFAEAQQKTAVTLRQQAGAEADPDKRNALNAQADQLDADWGEHGTLRLLAHTVVGGLTGGASGAAGAAVGTLTAPVVANTLAQAGIDGPLASTLTAIASTTAGALARGTAGGAAAMNEVANNYLKHEEINKLVKSQANCAAGSVRDCQAVSDLNALDKKRQEDIQNSCASFTSDSCRVKLTEAGRDFDGLVLYQQSIWENIKSGKTTFEEMKPYLNKAALEIKDIAGPLKDYYYSMSGGDTASPYWTAYKQIDGLNANDLANLWNATAAIGSTRKTLLASAADTAAGNTVGRLTVTDINFYRDGSMADPMLPMSASGPWKSVAELSPAQAQALVNQALPQGSVVVGSASADAANAGIVALNPNYKPSYMANTEIVEFVGTQPGAYVRLSGPKSESTANWVMKASDIAGLTPEQMAAKFALPAVPTQIGEVKIPAGTKLQASVANGILLGSNPGGGGVQFYIPMPKDDLPKTWFGPTRLLNGA